ncbi:Glucose-6-phosphate 1-dehydrogenase, partial [Rhizophlyctis rosea]
MSTIQQPASLPHPHISITIFGASGDLAKKKTFPALYSLIAHNQLPIDRVHFIGTARSDLKDDDFREKVSGKFKENADGETLNKFGEAVSYVKLESYTDEESYKRLDGKLGELEGKKDSGDHSPPLSKTSSVIKKILTPFKPPSPKQTDSKSKPLRIFYIALPPSTFGDVAKNVKKHAWSSSTINRIVVEKPYGRDLKTAKELSEVLAGLFQEEEIYRIDHYLGKDTVKSLIPLRFGSNPFFHSIWNKDHISHVSINFKEEFGAEGRGGYFDEFGMIRDVVQNHLMQLVVLCGMERPEGLGTEEVGKAKIDFINSIRSVDPKNVLIGQYTASTKDKEKKAYKDDETVKKDSKASTFATAVLYVDNERWRGVPWILRAGKALDEDHVSLRIHFKPSPHSLLPTSDKTQHQTLTLQDHPTKSLTLSLQTKKPGSTSFITSCLPLTLPLEKPPTAFSYIPEAYEVLLLDVVHGRKTWFMSREEAESGWRVWDEAILAADGRVPEG